MGIFKRISGCFCVAAVLAGVMGMGIGSEVKADVFTWEGVIGHNQAAGKIEHVEASYDDLNERLRWMAEFTPKNGVLANGFTLVLSDGPNPKGLTGQLAAFYFDASDEDEPVLTAYVYHGKNNSNSYFDGNGDGAGFDPDLILSSNDMSWVHELVVETNNGVLTLGFDVDASQLNSHSPLFPNVDGYEGVGFGEKLGVWFHPFAGLETDYEDDYLEEWEYSKKGWFDTSNLTTTVIPEPASMSLLGLAALGLVGRRRSA